jgi:pSer/pThr/pTyr-binding forkhead associated (FHA) protein
VARRLVITNGDWTTRQEIGETDIVIGRDPNCDLFFVNQRLSRRHARFEPVPEGVRLVDLGSRNGVWVNEKKIDQHLLAPGDTIRLGGLRIVFEEEGAVPRPEREGVDTTVLEGVDATVALSGRALATIAVRPAQPAQEEASPGQEMDSESPDRTVVHSRPPDDLGHDDRTVMLRDSDSTRVPDSTATVILGAGGAATSEQPATLTTPSIDVSTRIFEPPDATQTVASDEEPILVPEPEPLVVRFREQLSAWPWPRKFSVTIFGLSVLLGGLWVGLVRAGSWVAGIFFGLLFASVLARLATVLARKLLVEPLARLGRDADALGNGGPLSLGREYPELDALARSVNRLTGHASETREEKKA